MVALGIIILFYYVVYHELLHYIQIRRKYLARLSAARTLLVSGIPERYRSVSALASLYKSIGHEVYNVWLNRNVGALSQKIQTRGKLVTRLENAETILIRRVIKSYLASNNGIGKSETEDYYIGNDYVRENIENFLDHRGSIYLPILPWLLSIPLLGRKVDLIKYCREEIIRLNDEIEQD